VKREKVNTKIEQRLLTALITSDEFLSQASAVLDTSLIDVAPFRTIAEWCVEYHAKYHCAPRKDIAAIHESWAEDHDGPEANAIEDLLGEVSGSYDDHDPLNVPYMLDHLRAFLERKGLERLQDDVDNALHSGRPEDAKQHILGYKPVELLANMGIDPLRDTDAWERAFSISAKPLLEFPGDAGVFLNHALTRDAFIGIQGPEKRGKTWWCIEFVIRALRERLKVAFFQVGDLSEHQAMIRIGTYFAQRPSRADLCGNVDVPTEIIKPQRPEGEDEEEEEGEGLQVRTKTRVFNKPLTKTACIKAGKKFMKGCGLNPNKSYFKVSIHPNTTVNVRGITSILDHWEMMEGFIPDVIVIDYADILAPEDPRMPPRDQVNDTWKSLRRLSQERHCLVLAPTQANASSYDTHTMTMRNFSEDKRKLAHVTGMIGLNQTENEKKVGVMRLNWLVLRESPFNVKRCLWVGQCLPIGRAFYCATL